MQGSAETGLRFGVRRMSESARLLRRSENYLNGRGLGLPGSGAAGSKSSGCWVRGSEAEESLGGGVGLASKWGRLGCAHLGTRWGEVAQWRT